MFNIKFLILIYGILYRIKVLILDQFIEVTEKTISCDGGEGSAGHPKVYFSMENNYKVLCPYCSREFVLVETPK